MQNIRIVFMGTPDFAVASLQAIVEAGYDVPGVVTAPDRPAGRGRELRASAVKAYALKKGIPVLQPENLKSPEFVDQLMSLDATLFVVVAFRMLPEKVWSMPPLGTFNLHASLLPQYRGAAPINRAVMDGATIGGVTTFFLRHEIDTGNIIFREETPISPTETAGDYHDRLMLIGSELVIRTIEAIRMDKVIISEQKDYIRPGETLRTAPKLSKEDGRINWSEGVQSVFNLIRGLSPYPGAFTELTLPSGKKMYLKIYRAVISDQASDSAPGTIFTDYKTYFDIQCADGRISLQEVQQAGKKRMNIHDFLLGLNTSMLS